MGSRHSAVLATFVGFLYMFRLAYAVFLGERKAEFEAIAEAPLALLVPQYVLIIAILALSFFPKLFMEPVSAAIDPAFAATLVWDGMSLETIYGYWNPIPVMAITVADRSGSLFRCLAALHLRVSARPDDRRCGLLRILPTRLSRLLRPVAIAFWRGVSDLTLGAAGSVRKIYTGNGQTYSLYVLWYVIAIYAIGTLIR